LKRTRAMIDDAAGFIKLNALRLSVRRMLERK
jgi:hypothetical protein